MKIKIFRGSNTQKTEDAVNKFIDRILIDVKDIKISSNFGGEGSSESIWIVVLYND